jgi:hypothetical protein
MMSESLDNPGALLNIETRVPPRVGLSYYESSLDDDE